MEQITLEVQSRQGKGKSGAKALRREGFIPAVVYGGNNESLPIQLTYHDFIYFVHHHRLETTVITLNIKGQQARTVLVKDVQYHPVKEEVVHIDFQEISLTSKIKVKIGVVSVGEPIGVKQEAGVLNHILWELEVECLPTQIPEEIKVDVSNMKMGDIIYVKDLLLPEGVSVIDEPDSLVFAIEHTIKEEPVESAVEGEVKAEPEVIKEKKEVPPKEEEKEKEKEKK